MSLRHIVGDSVHKLLRLLDPICAVYARYLWKRSALPFSFC